MSEVIRMHRTGGPSVLVAEQETIGAPAAGQVKIRHHAIGINFIDTMFRSGTFGVALPFVNGVEGAGEVIEVGPGVENFAVGDRVGYFFAPGAYASERLIDVLPLVKLPADLPSEIAASLLTKGATAWLAVRKLHPVEPGDIILVQGATGGVGSLVARWVKTLGATVIAVGSGKKLQRLQGIADHLVPSESATLSANIRKVAPDGVDVVYDLIGGATFDATLAAVKDGGDIFTIGPHLEPRCWTTNRSPNGASISVTQALRPQSKAIFCKRPRGKSSIVGETAPSTRSNSIATRCEKWPARTKPSSTG
jgi:NADPH2:quinone reductase